jgi:hypothetical protein
MSICRFQFQFRGSGESLLERIRTHLVREGGELTGATSGGTFFLSTPVGVFRGIYTTSEQTIFLEVTEKPFFVPCGTIEARLASYVKESI